MVRQYLEDIKVHEKRRSSAYLLTSDDVAEYERRWGPHLFHRVSGQAERGGQIISNAQVVSISSHLMNSLKPEPAIEAGIGFDEMRFRAPARVGDTLAFECQVVSKRESKSDPRVGIVRAACRLFNQRNEDVLTYVGIAVVTRRTVGSVSREKV